MQCGKTRTAAGTIPADSSFSLGNLDGWTTFAQAVEQFCRYEGIGLSLAFQSFQPAVLCKLYTQPSSAHPIFRKLWINVPGFCWPSRILTEAAPNVFFRFS